MLIPLSGAPLLGIVALCGALGVPVVAPVVVVVLAVLVVSVAVVVVVLVPVDAPPPACSWVIAGEPPSSDPQPPIRIAAAVAAIATVALLAANGI